MNRGRVSMERFNPVVTVGGHTNVVGGLTKGTGRRLVRLSKTTLYFVLYREGTTLRGVLRRECVP